MKKYYLVRVQFDNGRYPFRNQVFCAKSEQEAIAKYHDWWSTIDDDVILSINAQYLGIGENLARFVEACISKVRTVFYIPLMLGSFIVGIIVGYDPEMFRAAERRKDPYKNWVRRVALLGRPIYWMRCLLGTRDSVWVELEKEHDV